MLNWKIIENDKVKLTYEEGEIIVKKSDFDRAFGTMINSSYEDIKRDFAIE